MAPAYLAADCQLVLVHRQLRFVTWRTCVVRRTYSNYGDRCFAAAGPKLWNSLPADLRQADISFQRFNRLLKTFLFGCWDLGALWLTIKAALHKFSYLLTYTVYARCQQLKIKLKQTLQKQPWSRSRIQEDRPVSSHDCKREARLSLMNPAAQFRLIIAIIMTTRTNVAIAFR